MTKGDLYGAKLLGAKIDGAEFTDVRMSNSTRQYLCTIASGTTAWTHTETRTTLNCSYNQVRQIILS
ncbi:MULTISPECIES: hypothetical protein [Aerosakkonema]|uniref:hypothetical protein n=1 Tax=Aerosakkonema TaxID=1246629 RepID=UPI0035B97492